MTNCPGAVHDAAQFNPTLTLVAHPLFNVSGHVGEFIYTAQIRLGAAAVDLHICGAPYLTRTTSADWPGADPRWVDQNTGQ